MNALNFSFFDESKQRIKAQFFYFFFASVLLPANSIIHIGETYRFFGLLPRYQKRSLKQQRNHYYSQGKFLILNLVVIRHSYISIQYLSKFELLNQTKQNNNRTTDSIINRRNLIFCKYFQRHSFLFPHTTIFERDKYQCSVFGLILMFFDYC